MNGIIMIVYIICTLRLPLNDEYTNGFMSDSR